MSDERVLSDALEAAFRWLYQDTRDYVRGKKPDPKFDGSFLNDLADMRAGLKVLERRKAAECSLDGDKK